MYAVSCPDAGLCVAGTLYGALWTSTNPAADDAGLDGAGQPQFPDHRDFLPDRQLLRRGRKPEGPSAGLRRPGRPFAGLDDRGSRHALLHARRLLRLPGAVRRSRPRRAGHHRPLGGPAARAACGLRAAGHHRDRHRRAAADRRPRDMDERPDQLHGHLAAVRQRRQRLPGHLRGERRDLPADRRRRRPHGARPRDRHRRRRPGAPAASPATAIVKAAPVAPVASAPPAITGTARAGDLLTATHGTWANGPTSYTDTWQRCNNAGSICTPIAGANGLSYRPTALDVGYTLRVSETASNSAGTSAPAASAPTALVQAAPTGGGRHRRRGGTGGGGAGGTGGGGGGGGPAPAPALVRATTSGPLARVTVSCAAACRLTLTITVTETLRRGKVIAVSAKKRKVVIGKATTTLAAGQSRTVRVSLNKAGRKLLAGRRRFKARLAVSQAASPVSRATLTFRRR